MGATSRGRPGLMSKKCQNYVPSPQFCLLDQACVQIAQAFGDYPFQVGSSLERRDFRDVDVRLILEDSEYDRLFKSEQGDALWSLMCQLVSSHLSQVSGLQVDFQVQRQTQANEKHPGTRNALGVFLNYPGERPSDVLAPSP